MNARINSLVINPNEAVVISRQTGHFLIGGNGRTLGFSHLPGPIFRLAMKQGLRVLNNTSPKAARILSLVNG